MTNHTLKPIFVTLYLLAGLLTAHAQPAPQRVIYVIDSMPVKTGMLTYLPSKNIESIRVPKSGKGYRDTIFMKLKDHEAFFKLLKSKFLSPDDIARKYISGYNAKSQVLFMWNDKLLSDTAEAGVFAQYFDRAEVVKIAKTAYAKTLPKAAFLKIFTKSPDGNSISKKAEDQIRSHKILRQSGQSLAQIARQNIADLHKTSSVIFFRDDTLLTDTTHVKIPAANIFETKMFRARKTSYYENFPETTFLYIYTKPQPVYVR